MDSIEGIDSFVITLDDGTFLHVQPCAFGGPNAPYPVGERLRWMIWDSTGKSVVGPPIGRDRTPEGVRDAVARWWADNQ